MQTGNKYQHDNITPYHSNASKKEQVTAMFNNIANTYDKINRILSFRIDILWRNKLVKELKKTNATKILDIATGTGDLAITIAKENQKIHVTAIDIAEKMLLIGNKKIKEKNLQYQIKTQIGDAESLPFESNMFDAIAAAFGIRNFENLNQGLKEIYRTLKPEGFFFILEFSNPTNFFIKIFYSLYQKIIINGIGKLLSRNKTAYNYLNQSAKKFPSPEELKKTLNIIGFKTVTIKPLTFGICTLYIAKK